MPGLALSGGRLHALEADTMEGWRLAGTIGTPVKKKIIALAIRAGLAFVLDSIGAVHRLNSLTGKWDDPVVLSKDYQWKGICALAEGGDWLALGRPMHEVGVRELWHFSPPAHKKKKKTVLP
uniref:Uncharacterized protein n=1 Tax=Alexandrium andersonii TaxID=327968 RepID=A0A7S2BYQ4_9DINO|mmetsp:Transcript_3161/g.7146  ORF Transcript_3161/g.7146 Transcript_3161/m.7146 type:complete len:122 (+) Transcript_3161:1-366(+)